MDPTNKTSLITNLALVLPVELATDLVDDFLELRQEVVLGNLGKTTAGKFIESVVQIIQFLDTGSYDKKPNVDDFLKNFENKKSSLDDGLKLCVTRVGRAVYSIRNKRGIAHKNIIKKNLYDLLFVFNACQWILTEFIRQILYPTNIEFAGKIIELIQKPISSLTEEFEDRKIVYGKYSAKEEILILLNESFPEYVDHGYIKRSLERRSPSTITNALRELWENKLIHKHPTDSFKFKVTHEGLKKIKDIIL